MRARIVSFLLLCCLTCVAWGCTDANPAYVESDLARVDGSAGDGPPVGDGPGAEAAPDLLRPPDLLPPSDTVPWQCVTHADCDDKLSCTVDRCDPGTNTCNNAVAAGHCLIAGTCYTTGAHDPANPCTACAPAVSTSIWTPRTNGTPCDDDGLSCTADRCEAGSCVHPVHTGCLIGGSCVPDGATSPTDPCEECVPSLSSSAWSFIAGKSCSASTGMAGTCFDKSCRGWTDATYEPSTAQTVSSSILTGVAYIPVDGKVWATGAYTTFTTSSAGGVIVRLGNLPAKETHTAAPLQALHDRVAVGNSGALLYHNGATWVGGSTVGLSIGSVDRFGVWGGVVQGKETFLLSGWHGGMGDPAGIIQCTLTQPGATCFNHSGFSNGALIGRVFATVDATSLGRAWALHVDEPWATEPEDIYSAAPGSKSWSTASPEGCKDYGTNDKTACSATPDAFTDMHGTSASDIWAVGAGGTLLRYDGTEWTRPAGKLVLQGLYDLDAIYSSPGDKLVTIVAHRDSAVQRDLATYTYNVALDRWFGPNLIRTSPITNNELVRDIGGNGYANLWMVGQTRDGLKLKGLILRLQ